MNIFVILYSINYDIIEHVADEQTSNQSVYLIKNLLTTKALDDKIKNVAKSGVNKKF